MRRGSREVRSLVAQRRRVQTLLLSCLILPVAVTFAGGNLRGVPGPRPDGTVVVLQNWRALYPFSQRYAAQDAKGVQHVIDLAAIRFLTDSLRRREAGGWVFSDPDLSSFSPEMIVEPFNGPDEELFLVQAEDPPSQLKLRKDILGIGAEILAYIPEGAYLVRLDKKQMGDLATTPHVFWMGYYQPVYRLDPKLEYVILSDASHELGIRVLLDRKAYRGIAEVLEALKTTGLEVFDVTDEGRHWDVRTRGKALLARSAALLPGCLFVERWVPFELHNNVARTSAATATGRGSQSGPIMDVEDVWARGIRGEGQIAAAADTGLSTGDQATLHRDFGQQGSATNPMRVIQAYALGRTGDWSDDQSAGGGHGTHTSGSIVGNGVRSGADPSTNTFPSTSYAGTAPKAQFVFQSVMDSGGGLGGLPSDLNNLFQPPYDDGARVHSNSWGAAVAGDYTTDSQNVDKFIWNNPDMVITFSAGNSGVDGKAINWLNQCKTTGDPIDGVIDTDSIGAPGTAKNCITVGASENYRPSFVYEYPEGDCSGDGFTQQAWGWFSDCSYSTNPIYSDLMADDASGMGAFSSRGPTDDERIKPDITAPGIAIISTRTDKNQVYEQWGTCSIPSSLRSYYMTMGGTSMANPLTAGAAVLVRQYYVDGWHANGSATTNGSADSADGFDPSAALVKATLINGAWDMNPGQYGTGSTQEIPPGWDSPLDLPNNVEGYGRVDLEHSLFPGSGWGDDSARVVEVHDVGTGLTTGQSHTYPFTVGGAANPLIITLAWTDPYGATSAGTELVNDLDLVVTSPGGSRYWPNRKDWTGGSVDRKNNVEQVYVSAPGSGTWSIQVEGYSVPGNGVSGTTVQPYALVISGIPGSSCTNPGQPVIDSITDDDSCAQSGVTITYTAGSGATSHDLYVDGTLVVSGFASGSSYDPGDTASHSYVIRAVDGSCSTDSAPMSATDADDSPGQPVITGITDVSGCSQSGIQITYTAGSGATSHDLVRDGTVVVTGYASGATYDPGDTASHSYVVRAVNGSCTTDSAAQSATDQEGTTPTFAGIASAADADDCADTGVTLTWALPSDWGDNGETAGRGFNIYRGTTLVTTVGATTTSYTDTGGTNGTTYAYKVEAVNGCSLTADGGATASAADAVSVAPTFAGISSASDVDACADSGVTLTWSAPGDWGDNGVGTANRGFNIYRGATLVTTVAATSTSYTDTGGTNGTTYTYKVEAVNGCSLTSDGGATASASDDVGGAVFAGISSATDISGCEVSGIQLAWPAVSDWNDGGANPDQRQYQVQRSDNGGGTWSLIGTGPETGLPSYTWNDTTTVAGTSYLYRIVTVNGTGCLNDAGATAAATDVQGATPTFGGITSATDVDGCTASGIALSWGAATDWGDSGENSAIRKYIISRDGSAIASVDASTTSYTDTTAPANTSVTYTVTAENGCALTSDGGASLSATNTDNGTPPTFAGLSSVTQASDGSCSLDLAWSAGTAVCGGVAYNIYRDTTSGFTPAAANRIASGVTSTSYTDSGLTGGTTYYYVVRAFDTSNGAEDGNTVEQSGTPSSGGGTQVLYQNDFESGTGLADWSTGWFNSGGDADDWRGIQSCTAYSGTHIFRFGGASCTDDYATDKFAYAAPNGANGGIAVPATATDTRLSFYHRWEWESGYDGGTLLLSLDGTNFSFVPASAIVSGPSYNDTTSTICPPDNGGSRDVWSGSQTAFVSTEVDLDPVCDAITGGSSGCQGQTLWIAFAGITDCLYVYDGWFLDDVLVTATVPGSSCTTTTEVSSASSSYPAQLVRDDASSTGYYLYFEPISGADSYNVYEGTHGSYYDHTCLAQGVTTATVTSGTWNGFLRAEITPSTTGSHYYLVTEMTGAAEGSIGFDSNSTERPNSGCP